MRGMAVPALVDRDFGRIRDEDDAVVETLKSSYENRGDYRQQYGMCEALDVEFLPELLRVRTELGA